MKFTLKKTVLATIAVAFLGISGMTTSTAKADEWVARTTDEVKDEIVHNEEGVQEYTVKYGDTLSVIAEAMDVSLDALIRVNDIQNANLIYAGTTIKFSADKQEVVVKTEEEHTYKVEDNTEVVEVKAVEPTPQTATSQEVQTTTTTQADPAATEGYTLTVEATAYSYAEAGLSSYTADGTNLVNDPMVIAVDPRVIPLGTMVEIPGYGVFRAADTGGAIVGNKIDVHFPTVAQTYNFGRRTITIRILK